MIDSTRETIITFNEAADELPRRRRGRKCHVSTFYRWATVGCRGVVLESIQVGGTRCTSREALQRFFERLSRLPGEPTNTTGTTNTTAPVSRVRTRAQRLRDSERAAAALERMGA